MGTVGRTLRDLVPQLALLALAVTVALIATNRILGAAGTDLVILGVALGVTGVAGLAAAVITPAPIMRLGVRGQLVLLVAVCLASLVVNLLVAASLMFISGHDLRLLFVLIAFALVATVGPLQLVSRRGSARIREVAAAAARLGAGDLHTRLQTSGNDEVAQLAEEFNRMAQALLTANAQRDQLESARLDLFASVSHDLRTPLSSIQVMVEALTDGVVSDAETSARYLATISAELARLSLLIDDLFELARIDSGELRLRLEAVHVEEVLREAVAAFRPRLERNDIRLRFEPVETPVILADPVRLSRVVHNLLGNALRHTPHDGSIELVTVAANGSVTVAVRDSGDGISPADQPRVFERFFRGEKSRSRAGGGSGLGLAIARAIVEAHGGQIWVETGRPRGASIMFSLPVAEPQASGSLAGNAPPSRV